MTQQYKDFDQLIKLYLPQGSAITRVCTNERFGSIVVDIHHIIPVEYQKEHNLASRRRILSIRLIQGERDQGLPINSFADPN